MKEYRKCVFVSIINKYSFCGQCWRVKTSRDIFESAHSKSTEFRSEYNSGVFRQITWHFCISPNALYNLYVASVGLHVRVSSTTANPQTLHYSLQPESRSLLHVEHEGPIKGQFTSYTWTRIFVFCNNNNNKKKKWNRSEFCMKLLLYHCMLELFLCQDPWFTAMCMCVSLSFMSHQQLRS